MYFELQIAIVSTITLEIVHCWSFGGGGGPFVPFSFIYYINSIVGFKLETC